MGVRSGLSPTCPHTAGFWAYPPTSANRIPASSGAVSAGSNPAGGATHDQGETASHLAFRGLWPRRDATANGARRSGPTSMPPDGKELINSSIPPRMPKICCCAAPLARPPLGSAPRGPPGAEAPPGHRDPKLSYAHTASRPGPRRAASSLSIVLNRTHEADAARSRAARAECSAPARTAQYLHAR